MSTAAESQHTAGAMRAARTVMSSTSPLTVKMMAEIIDRETAAPAMLDALKECAEWIRALAAHEVQCSANVQAYVNAMKAIHLAEGESL